MCRHIFLYCKFMHRVALKLNKIPDNYYYIELNNIRKYIFSGVVIVHTTTTLGPDSQGMICPSCHHQISTRVETKATTKTHLMALLLCLFLYVKQLDL